MNVDLNSRQQPWLQGLALLAVVVIGSGLAVLLLANALTYPINHDEQQYVAASVLAQHALPYRDFVYLQTPNYPLVISALYRVFDVEDYFISARWANFGFSFLVVLFTGLTAYRLFRSTWLALGCAGLIATSTVMTFSYGVARNDILPCAFQALAIFLMVGTSRLGAPTLHAVFWAGVCASLAVGSKVSYVYLPAALFVAAIWMDVVFKSHRWLMLVGGGLVGAIPVGFLALIDFDAFWYGNIQYHTSAPIEWYSMRGLEGRLTLSDRLYFMARKFIASPGTLAVGVAVIAAFACLLLSGLLKTRVIESIKDGRKLVVIVTALFAIPMSVLPNPAWIQYFVPLMPLLVLLIPVVVDAVPDGYQRISRGVAGLAMVIAVLWSGAFMGQAIQQMFDRKQWADQDIKQVANFLNQTLKLTAEDRVATLSPMHVLDSKASIYPELAAGPFFYRTAHLLAPETIVALGGVGVEGLSTLLDANPPAAILVGYEQDPRKNLDADFVQYAEDRGYKAVALENTPIVLYINPDRS